MARPRLGNFDLAVIAALAIAWAAATGCAVDDSETWSQTHQAATVDEVVDLGCSTAVVRELSEQIADEMLCLAPGMLVRFEESEGLVFSSQAVIPLISPEARDALLAAVAATPEELVINSAFRSVAQQYIIVRWFQAGDCGITAAAQPGRSNHESGRAIDVDNHLFWATTLPVYGWVQTVLPNDPVHFEHLESPDVRGLDVHAFQRLWNRNHPDDLIDEDGDYGPATADRLGMAPADGFSIGACQVNGNAGGISLAGDSLQMESGERLNVRLAIVNVGSTAWEVGAYTLAPSAPLGRQSSFHDPEAWISESRVIELRTAVATGESLFVDLPLFAPEVSGETIFGESFALVDDNGTTLAGAELVLEIVVVPAGSPPGDGCDDCSGSSSPGLGALFLFGLVLARVRDRRRVGCQAAAMRYGGPPR